MLVPLRHRRANRPRFVEHCGETASSAATKAVAQSHLQSKLLVCTVPTTTKIASALDAIVSITHEEEESVSVAIVESASAH